MPSATLTYTSLTEALRRQRIGVDASELHGSLIGYLCAGALTDADHWLHALHVHVDHTDATQDPVLTEAYLDGCKQLAAAGFVIDPLLPADQLPLTQRAEALLQWCRGFLGGVGLADAGGRVDALDGDSAEVLPDIARIAATRIAYGDSEQDKAAFVEVLEFVRVGVMVLHDALLAKSAAAGTLH